MSCPLLQGEPVPALGFSLQTLNSFSWGPLVAARAAERLCLNSVCIYTEALVRDARRPHLGRESWGLEGIAGPGGAAPSAPLLYCALNRHQHFASTKPGVGGQLLPTPQIAQ